LLTDAFIRRPNPAAGMITLVNGFSIFATSLLIINIAARR
jgi:hypothetical protein